MNTLKHNRREAYMIVKDAPISLKEFALCFPIGYQKCAGLLAGLAADGFIKRVPGRLYTVVT